MPESVGAPGFASQPGSVDAGGSALESGSAPMSVAAPGFESSPESESSPEAAPVIRAMAVSSEGISGGVIADKYGMRGDQVSGGVPTRSIPVSVADAPEGTVCYAVSVYDPDSVPLCGYEWAHWLAVNVKSADIAENASIDGADGMVQGKNDFDSVGYGGPTPPDKAHTYVVTVYALDAELPAENGFDKGEFAGMIEGHVLAEARMTGRYDH